MNKSFIAPTTYFLQEGRENLDECLKVAFQAAMQQKIGKIVIFTAFGDGIKKAQEDFCNLDEYAHIRLVAVTFPAGKVFTDEHSRPYHAEISDDVRELLHRNQIPLVRAHLPFDPIEPSAALRMRIGDDLNLMGEALNMFCGSMSLCVQAVALACDAGHIQNGEHVIALTSDTAILAKAAVTSSMLSQLIVREILCKPAILTIGRKEMLPAPKIVEAHDSNKLQVAHKSKRATRARKKLRQSTRH